MKRYLKNFELTESFVKDSIYACLNQSRWKRKDTAIMLAEYQIKALDNDLDKYALAKAIRNQAYKDKTKLFPIVDYMSKCIYKEIQERNITLTKIRYQTRQDGSNGKMREIGIASMKQQLYDYIAVNACRPMLNAKICTYQCASIPQRGQLYGVHAVEKWVRKNPKKCKWIIQCDIKKFYPSVNKDILKNYLKRDIVNSDVLYIIFTLIDSYKQGLSIGSYLSQYLANYILSYAYHYLDEYAFKTRRSKRINMIYKKLFYMDDILLLGSSKSNVRQTLNMLINYLSKIWHLTIKPEWKTYMLNERPIDMMGYKITQYATTIRKRIFDRANALFLKFKDKSMPMTLREARRCVSYYGYFTNSDSKRYCRKTKVDYIIKKAKETIKNEQNANNQHNATISIYAFA